MAAKAVLCYGSSTSSTTLCPVLCPQQLNKRVFFAVNSRRCSININHKSLSFPPKGVSEREFGGYWNSNLSSSKSGT
ncbi:hypothetical protein OIU76_002398 [Salix suchowensis]|nr:hypothetical protein OIU76_002398 [Salix suchowensis]